MPQGNQDNAKLIEMVAAVCTVCKIDRSSVSHLPLIAVSGDVGDGFFCSPESLDDLAFLAHVPEKGRPNVLAFAMRGAMQKAQAALKQHDKTNKITNENASEHKDARLKATQDAFAGALNGKKESTFNDSSLLRAEAVRIFKETKVKPWLSGEGKDTSPDSLEQGRAALERDHAAAYPGWIETIMGDVAKARTYEVSRKTETAAIKVETAGFKFA